MTSDGTWTYNWEHGRELMSMSNGSTTWTYTYNADGLRTKRTNGSTTYNYIYNGSSLSQMTVGSNTLYFAYDASGTPMSVTYNGTNYYYATNLQGEVTAILNTSGTAVVQYTYDAWGNILTTTGSMASTLGAHNPLRYRGYVYDTETTLYYLQSRYYDPELGRFINADAYTSTGQGILGNNMFAYCLNNPLMYYDLTGTLPKFLKEFIDTIPDWVDTPLGLLKYVAERNKQGYLFEYWVTADAIVRWGRHHTNHGNAKDHPYVPHDHEWHEDDDGTNWQDPKGQQPDPGFQAPKSGKDNSTKVVAETLGIVATGYALYVGIKWVVAFFAAPATGGGSLIVAGVTP